MNLNAFIYLFLTLLKFSYSKLSDQCTKSNALWNSLKYPYIDILKQPTTQSTLLTCQHVSSQNCCSSDTSKDMASVSELKLKVFADEKIESILMMFTNDSYDLMNIYLKDLENTKNDLNQLFSTTYGYNYKVHKEFFFTWFDKLKLYMQGRLHNIGQLLDNFFLEMTQRIVRILIAPDSTPDITACRTTRLIEAKPYQETDVLLKKKIIRSYPPARLLVNGIAVGRDVFNELLKNTIPSSKCVEQFNSAFHCMLCQGLTLKSCSQSCAVIIDNCFGSYKSSDMKKLDRAFIKYIRNLVLLAGKLDNPFNFPEVNSKMNVQISTAIMNVQNMYPNVKDQINAKCQGAGTGGGGLPISRKRRQASKEFYKWQNVDNNPQKPWWEQKLAKNVNEENTEKKDFNNYQNKANDALSPFARKIKQKYKALETFFKDRRTEFCSTLSTTDASVDCWNGTTVVKNAPAITVKEPKKKIEKADDRVIKSAISQLNEISKKINSYITDKNPDPETIPVQEYKLFVSRKVNKVSENSQDNSQSQVDGNKIEGSGELEGSKFPQTNNKPEKTKNEPTVPPVVPPLPDKTNGEFSSWPEGSGDLENKLPDEKTKKTPQLPIKPNPVTVSSSTHLTVSPTKPVIVVTTPPSTVAPNQIPDDEDLNPPTPESQPKVNVPAIITTTIATIIQPEGSGGNQPALPDMSEKKPPIPQPITTTTTQSPESFPDGSGDETKPKQPIDKPSPGLPMLPDPSKSVTNPPIQKPDSNPDEEKPTMEGSGGKSPDQPITPELEPQPITQPPAPVIIESTKPPTDSLSPEQYPGKVPPEVWLPGLKGVNNEETDNQRTTPTGWALSLYRHRSDMKTMLILCSLYYLL